MSVFDGFEQLKKQLDELIVGAGQLRMKLEEKPEPEFVLGQRVRCKETGLVGTITRLPEGCPEDCHVRWDRDELDSVADFKSLEPLRFKRGDIVQVEGKRFMFERWENGYPVVFNPYTLLNTVIVRGVVELVQDCFLEPLEEASLFWGHQQYTGTITTTESDYTYMKLSNGLIVGAPSWAFIPRG